MADPDTSAGAAHPDAAGWVLGVLDAEGSGRFEIHLESCQECQQTVAELAFAAHMLKTPDPPGIDFADRPEPPADLAARTRARVAQAAGEAGWRLECVRCAQPSGHHGLLLAAGAAPELPGSHQELEHAEHDLQPAHPVAGAPELLAFAGPAMASTITPTTPRPSSQPRTNMGR